VTQPKFTLHAQRPRRQVRADSPLFTIVYGLITYGVVLTALYFICRCFPAFWRVIMHGAAS